jgi:hypothetical protein
MAAGRRRALWSPEQIQQHISALRQSGLTAAAYARQQNLRYTTLQYWLRRQRSAHQRRSPAARFQSLAIGPLLAPGWAAEVVQPGGLIVRLSPQVPPALVSQLLSLSARPC